MFLYPLQHQVSFIFHIFPFLTCILFVSYPNVSLFILIFPLLDLFFCFAMIEKKDILMLKGEDNMKVGFIGTGNMAQAIIDGLLKKRNSLEKKRCSFPVDILKMHKNLLLKLASMHAKVIRKLHHNQISFF